MCDGFTQTYLGIATIAWALLALGSFSIMSSKTQLLSTKIIAFITLAMFLFSVHTALRCMGGPA